MTLPHLNGMDRESFVAALGGVFEGSPWVAEGVYPGRPFASLAELHAAMTEVVRQAGEARQLELIRAHPDLAGRAALADELSEHSRSEQAGAGLNRLSPEEYARFHQLNDAYKAKFGFPFILAVKGHTKDSILQAFEARLPNDAATERETALGQIYKIARFRLGAMLGDAA
jgi:2-oxo-4-hydroxy-4-carboxy-5-ureidoimidazoline decarboxylase